MSENIEIRTVVGNRNLSTVSDSPVTDPAAGAKVCTHFSALSLDPDIKKYLRS